MTSLEQRRKPYGRHEGQDHGTRGTDRGKIAYRNFRKALSSVVPNPEYADDPELQERVFKFDLEDMRWSMRYDKHRDEVSRTRIQKNRVPKPGDPIEDVPTEDEIAPAQAPHGRGTERVHVSPVGHITDAEAVEIIKRDRAEAKTRLNYLYRTVAGLVKELNNTPRKSYPESWVSQADLDRRVDELEGEIESIKEEIEELEEGGKTTIPFATDAEMGLMTEKQKEGYLQRKHGDMESDDEDDHGLDSLDNGIRAHKLPKKTWY